MWLGIKHAASSGTLPEDVESEYIRRLFDDFADRFEDTLVGHLAYDTPHRMKQFLHRHAADGAASVLDLGCGTGLMGQQLARSGRSIDGVDLSPRMLDHARAKEGYRDLHAGDPRPSGRAGLVRRSTRRHRWRRRQARRPPV
jgi:predicted TPR repeat methyltransferase